MSRLCGLAIALFMVVLSPLLARAEDGPTFKTVILPDSIRFVQVFSEDKKAGTMLFDNFVLATESGKGSLPSVATKSFTYVLQPQADGKASVKHMIRGFVSQQDGGSAAMLVHVGGATTLVDFGKATKEADAAPRNEKDSRYRQAIEAAKEQGMNLDPPPGVDSDYLAEFETPVSAGKPLQITLILLVDRLPGDDGSGALLTVDSIDFEIGPAKR